jgi:hypothetical protein
VSITADRRLHARFDGDAGRWHIDEGDYEIAVGKSAVDLELTAKTSLSEADFGS